MRFHVNAAGEAGKCSATQGNCPFGGEEEHYTSLEAARKSFEKSQASFSMPLKEMNAQAKTTDDPEVIKNLIANGSERTLANLAKNPNLKTPEAEDLLKKIGNVGTRAVVFGRKDLNVSFESLTPDDLEELVARYNVRGSSNPFSYPTNDPLARIARDSNLTEAHYDKLLNSSRLPYGIDKTIPQILAHENKIPKDRTIEWLEATNWSRYPLDANVALMAGKISEDDLKYKAPDDYIRNSFSATGPSPRLSEREVEILARVAAHRENPRLIGLVASDSRITSRGLEALAKSGYGSEEIYLNPKTPASAKVAIEETHANEPFVRMAKLKEKLGDQEFASIKRSAGGSQLGRSYSESRTAFDVDKIKAYGLTRDDIMYLAQARGYNAGVGYDEETGIFFGRIDSSG